MSIWKGRAVPEMKRIRIWVWGMLELAAFMIPQMVWACSCAWKGPFLDVSANSPLVVQGKIIRLHPGSAPAMDVLVLETLKGGLLDSGMRVQMGDGMHCRPALDAFPPDTEWILALNGPGSKPGSGLALSLCGGYWLRVENGDVVGSIDGTEKQVQRMPLPEFTARFRYPPFHETIRGRIQAGERFCRSFGSRFEFILDPTPSGWQIAVREFGRDEDLSRLTPPLHFSPNPRDIEGWHLSKNPADCTSRSYGAEAGPENPRKFIFSPEVGQQIDGPRSGRSVTSEEVEAVRRFGLGTLTITGFRLEPGTDGCPKIKWLQFSVVLDGGKGRGCP